MFTTIVELEEKLDKLLPTSGIYQHKQEQYELMLEASSLWSSVVWETAQKLEPLSFTQEQIKQGFQFSESAIFVCTNKTIIKWKTFLYIMYTSG